MLRCLFLYFCSMCCEPSLSCFVLFLVLSALYYGVWVSVGENCECMVV